nr:retrovirus-related Pol polyprotein from transposon TNT 1-94 [Tanacetum cinerariifolium]
MNMSPENKAYFLAEKEAIHLILTGIRNEIYSTVDACQTAQEMWESIERLQQGESFNIQDVKTNLFWEFGKEIAKPITPPSEITSKEDNDPEQAQRDKDRQKNLALIAKYFKKIYKPTNNNLRTSSYSRNKNVDTNLRYKNDDHSKKFRNQRTLNVVGAREKLGSPVVQQSGIQCFNCREFGHFANECRKPKRVKDSAYHKEKMLLCKQAEQGVPLQAEQYDWLLDTDEEVDEQELEAHYSYMAKIQEVPTADSGTDSELVEQTEFEKYKAFNDHTIDYDKLECKLNEALGQLAQKDTVIKEGLKTKAYELSLVKEKHDKLIKQSLLTKSHYEGLVKQKTKVITDLKLREEHDIEKMLSMEKQLKFLNEVVYKRIQSIKTIHMMTPKVSTYNGRPTFANPRYLKQAQSEIPCLYAFPYDQNTHANSLIPDGEETQALEREYLFRAQTAQDMEILIQTCLMPLAIKAHNDSFKFVHKLKQEMHGDLKYVESIEKEIDELESDKAEFSNMYDEILQECVSKDVMCSYLMSLSDLDALDELQCLYLHKVKECDCLTQKLLKQTESISKKGKGKYVDTKFDRPSVVRQLNAQRIPKPSVLGKLAPFSNSLERIYFPKTVSASKDNVSKGKGKSVDTKFDRPSIVRQPNAQRIPKLSVLGKPTPFSNSLERIYFPKTMSVSKDNVSKGLSELVTTQTLPLTARQAVFVNSHIPKFFVSPSLSFTSFDPSFHLIAMEKKTLLKNRPYDEVRDTTCVSSENTELKIQSQAMEQQAQLCDGGAWIGGWHFTLGVVSAAKLPILNPNEFDLWKMRIERYFLMTDYSLWEVILNGDSPIPTRLIDGVVQHIALTTDEQRMAKKNELKARGIY